MVGEQITDPAQTDVGIGGTGELGTDPPAQLVRRGRQRCHRDLLLTARKVEVQRAFRDVTGVENLAEPGRVVTLAPE